MKWLLLLSCVVALARAVRVLKSLQEEWTDFKLQHNKVYASDTEEQIRLKIFAENMAEVALHNERFAKGEFTYWLGLNQYSDMSHQEFKDTMLGVNTKITRRNRNISYSTSIPPSRAAEMPASVDWRDKGAVTEVKDQGQCGASWAFSATGALEAQNFMRTDKLVSLSEQNLIDCSSDYNAGCADGDPGDAFRHVVENGGINTEESYPYEGKNGTCRFDPQNSTAAVTDIVYLQPSDENRLKGAVADAAPVSVVVQASEQFRLYAGGVFNDDTCEREYKKQAALVIGYGTDEKGGDYWLVKNSWGVSWGEKGYIRMARNKDSQCEIAFSGSYPAF